MHPESVEDEEAREADDDIAQDVAEEVEQRLVEMLVLRSEGPDPATGPARARFVTGPFQFFLRAFRSRDIFGDSERRLHDPLGGGRPDRAGDRLCFRVRKVSSAL